MDQKLQIATTILHISSAALLLLSKNEKRRKREWVKKWKERRSRMGSYKLLSEELRLEDKSAYRSYLRMDEGCFQEVIDVLKVYLTKQNTLMRDSISPEEKLAITLGFLATGETFRSLEYQSRLSLSLISNTIPEVCSLIYSHLKSRYLKFPENVDEWIEMSKKMLQRWQFPNCIGALDGKHIAFRASKTDGALYFNYKGFNSIILLAMCDANCKFIFIDVGCNGCISDGGVYNRSDLRSITLNPQKYLPADAPVGCKRILPYVIVADDAFALEKHLMKPYPYNSPERVKRIFNYRLSFVRQNIEHSLGVLTNRFRVLQTTIGLRPDKVKLIVQACCVLHNFLLTKSQDYLEPMQLHKPHKDDQLKSTFPTNPTKYANSIRGQYAEYFANEGQVPWQESYI